MGEQGGLNVGQLMEVVYGRRAPTILQLSGAVAQAIVGCPAIDLGATCVRPSTLVREEVSYDGQRSRLRPADRRTSNRREERVSRPNLLLLLAGL
jgi:hypothetical protein